MTPREDKFRELLMILNLIYILSWSGNSPRFMDVESSLPHSPEPIICTYSEPDQSSPEFPIQFLDYPF